MGHASDGCGRCSSNFPACVGRLPPHLLIRKAVFTRVVPDLLPAGAEPFIFFAWRPAAERTAVAWGTGSLVFFKLVIQHGGIM